MTSSDPMSENDFWLFGYGSLIWRPPPHFEERVPGFITGFVRRFWQVLTQVKAKWGKATDTYSEDHRGTPKAPGRVVTLIERSFWETLDDPQRETERDKVWGVAYKIVPSKVKEVQEYLDIREICGYSIQYTPFHPVDPTRSDIRCLVYIGLPDNPQFTGVVNLSDLAAKINESVGPSGENRDYVYDLEVALEELSRESHDEHVSDLARRVRALPIVIRDSKAAEVSTKPSHRVSSTEEQEEVEKDKGLRSQ